MPENFHNDESISNDDYLFRRVPQEHWFFDENQGRVRPSSAAFEDHRDGSPMSVSIKSILDRLMLTPEFALEGHNDFGLVSFTVGFARKNNQGVVCAPRAHNEAHGHVIGNKTRSVRRALARTAIWVIPPPE